MPSVGPQANPEPNPGESTAGLEALKRLFGRSGAFERYTLEGEIARGGMGAILRVWDEDLQRHLAMKVVLGQGQAAPSGKTSPIDAQRLARFLEEAQVTGQLDHPGIVPVHELGLDSKGCVYFTMKLVKGKTLNRVFDELAAKEGGWTQVRVLGLILKVCEAMAYAHHKGVIHRDLKPANVMVGKFGEVYVMDWGLARVLDRPDPKDLRIRTQAGATSEVRSERREVAAETPDSPLVTMDGDVVGTPSYMSPEQAAGRIGEMGPPSDVYAVGALLYQMLAGQMPYVPPAARLNNYAIWRSVQQGPPQSLREIAPSAPGELVAICDKAMARDPRRRYRDMAELSVDLGAYVEGRVVRAFETGAWAEARKWIARNRALAAALAAVVLAILAGALAFAWKAEEARTVGKSALVHAAQARYGQYVAAVLGARAARQAGEPRNVKRLLDSAPEEFREWEWRHLDAVSDTSLVTLEGHSESLVSAVFSPDGSRFLTASNDGTARLWDQAGNELARLEHEGSVHVALFQPGGTACLTSSGDTVRLWDGAGNERVRLTHGAGVTCASFRVDGALVLTAADRLARTWEASTGSEVLRLEHGGLVRAATFSPDGGRILTGCGDHTARIWDAVTGREVVRFNGHDRGVDRTTFSPDGTRILTASNDDHTVRLWDATTGVELARFDDHWNRVVSATFSSDGSRLLIASDIFGNIWSAQFGTKLAELQAKGGIPSAVFSPDGAHILTGSDEVGSILDATGGAALARLEGHTDDLESASYSPDGALVLTASEDRTARLWDAEVRGRESIVFEGHRSSLTQAIFSPDGRRVVTTAYRDRPRVWDASSGRLLACLETGLEPPQPAPSTYTDWCKSADYSPDGRRIVTCSNEGPVRVWDANTGCLITALSCEGNSAKFSPGGEAIAVATDDGWVRILDAATTQQVAQFEHPDRVQAAAFGPRGATLITAGEDAIARVWDLKSGREMMRFVGHAGRVNSAVFGPEETLVVTASEDGTARVWDPDTGKQVAQMEGHAGAVVSASFNPTGTRIVTASDEGTVRLWDLGGIELVKFDGLFGAASAVFSADGTRILSSSDHFIATLWDSVPRRARLSEARHREVARAEAVRTLDELLRLDPSLPGAARHLSSEPRIEDVVRDLALGEILVRCESAREWLDELKYEGLSMEESVSRVQDDAIRPREIKALALELLHSRVEGR